MKVKKVTSAVVGVGSSRRKNTLVRRELNLCFAHDPTKHGSQCIIQPYLTKPPYQYRSKPMSQDRSLGAIWYNRRRTNHFVY